MPRFRRLVVPDCPHHIIQRGNRRQRVFFCDADKDFYLRLLKRQSHQTGISFLAYCLLENHVHFIAVPKTEYSFAKGIGETHRKYTIIINAREDWKGYLWQGRFISFPMDETYLYAAIRYVERNPVRASIVSKAEDYPWSSALAHVAKKNDVLINGQENILKIEDWGAYLQEKDDEDFIKQIEFHEKTGRPFGSDVFLRKLELVTKRKILPQSPGRKRKIQIAFSNESEIRK